MVDQGIDTGDIVYRRDFEFPKAVAILYDYENYHWSGNTKYPCFFRTCLAKSY